MNTEEIIDTIYVNSRGERKNMVSGDVLDLWALGAACQCLADAKVPPLVGDFYLADLPMAGLRSLNLSEWIALSICTYAHKIVPVIATHNRNLDGNAETHRQLPADWAVMTSSGFVRGEDGVMVEVVFVVPR